MKQELLEKLKTYTCERVDKEVEPEFAYGTYPDLDEMVDSDNVDYRIRIASLEYGLDKLKDDPDPRVRATIAKAGYYYNQFINDPDPEVRKCAKRRI